MGRPKYRGNLYRLNRPLGPKRAFKTAIALSEPDSSGEIELLPVSPRPLKGFVNISRELKDFEEKKNPALKAFVNLHKRYLAPKGRVSKKIAALKDSFMERASREAVFDHVRRHFEFHHKKQSAFEPGKKIPYAGRVYDHKELTSLVDASLDFWLTAGRFTESFEEGLSSALGVRYCSLVNSGSSANLIAFMALTSPKLGERRIRRGDEVITVAAGFPTTVAPIVQYGAIPVFVDVELPSYNIDCAQLENALSGRTRAVFLAHTLGNPFNVKQVTAFCEKHGLWLIEDNCDALGSRVRINGKWRKTGSIGDLATCSFYPPHHITMGEGGAVVTSNAMLRRLVNSFRDWGRDCWCAAGHDDTCKNRFTQQFGELPSGYDHKYVYSHFGYNLKATDMQAAIGCEQLKKLDGFGRKRRVHWAKLKKGLADMEEVFVLPEAAPDADPSWFGFILTVRENKAITRDAITGFLESKGIQTRTLFAGNLIKHPCFDDMRKSGAGYRVAGSLNTTEIIMRNTFWIGVFPGLTEKMLDYMIKALHEAVGK